MYRRVAAVILALTLNGEMVHAQDTVLTVTVQSADVHTGPSTVTPVIGHAPRGTALPVARNLGSWARIAWPSAPDGVGYVHVTMGRLAGPDVEPSASPRTVSPAIEQPAEPLAQLAPPPPVHKTPADRVAVSSQPGGPAVSHVFGVGGLVGSMSSFGATARAWRADRFGVQVAFTRDTLESSTAAGRITSMQVEPALVYELLDHVSDYVWFRPYVGSGVSVRRQTLKALAPAAFEPSSDTSLGFRVFGGTELTFAGATRFGLSAEVGYRRYPTAFAGFEPDRIGVAIAGHWYVK